MVSPALAAACIFSAMMGTESIGTIGSRPSASAGRSAEASASPRLASMPRSTPVPASSAGERLFRLSLSTSAGMRADFFGPEMVMSTQPSTSKNRKLT